MSHTAAPDTAIAPTALYWDKLAAYLAHAFSLFGDPRALARRLWLSRRDHQALCDFLRPLEAIARRLIFVAALDLAPMTHPPAPERKFRARRAMPANAGALFDMDQPETWRVFFRTNSNGPPASSRQKSTRPSQQGDPDRISSAASATRLEALLRVLAAPDKHAAALACKIARNAAAAHAFTARPSRKLAHKTGYLTLFALIPLCTEAHQRFLHRKFAALHPDSS